MNIQHAITFVRTKGLRGVFGYVRSLSARRADLKKFEKLLITDSDWKPQPGITVVGDLSDEFSLSKTLRDFVTRLRECGIPCQAYDIGGWCPTPKSEYEHLLTPSAEFRLNRYTDIVGMFRLPRFPMIPCRLSRIGFWEFETGLMENNTTFYEPMEVVAMSDFNKDVFRRLVPSSTPVSKILYPFFFTPGRRIAADAVRSRYGIGLDDFVVFYNFSYLSSYYRKNPEGALRAFAEALGNREDAKIVFKTKGAAKCPIYAAKLRALAESLGLSRRVVFIDDYLLQDEIVALTEACDVYLSLHRGEGFGIGIAEAMSLGKPVVVSNYSAPTEFCKDGCTMLVPVKMVPVKKCEIDIKDYAHVKEWAEPDVHVAAAALSKLYDDRGFAKELGEKGKRFIADYFSDSNFKKSVHEFLARSENVK